MARLRLKPLKYVSKINQSFITTISSNDTKEVPDVVYIRTKARITPTVNLKSYERIIKSLKNDLYMFIEDLLTNVNNYDNKNYIFTVEMSEKSVQYKKNSHIHYDIYLKPLQEWKMTEHHKVLKKISDKINQKLIELVENYDFICH